MLSGAPFAEVAYTEIPALTTIGTVAGSFWVNLSCSASITLNFWSKELAVALPVNTWTPQEELE